MFKPEDILNSLSEAVIISDAENEIILYANSVARSMLGECTGRTRGEAFSNALQEHKSKSEYDNRDGVTAKIYNSTNGRTYAIYSKHTILLYNGGRGRYRRGGGTPRPALAPYKRAYHRKLHYRNAPQQAV